MNYVNKVIGQSRKLKDGNLNNKDINFSILLGFAYVADALYRGLAGKKGIAIAINKLAEAIDGVTLEVQEEE